MKLIHDVDVACRRLSRVLRLDTVRRAFEVQLGAEADAQAEWVIVYRTARGFCCMYCDVAVEFEEMLDVQIWSEEMEVQPYFIGL